MPDSGPTFEQWVDYCFTFGYSDFFGQSSDKDRQTRFDSTSIGTIANYLIRLFSDPAFVMAGYEDHQVATGIRYIFGGGSCYFGQLKLPDVPIELQIAVFDSVGSMYLRLFDRVCNRRGAAPDTDHVLPGADQIESELDAAVFMIWDMAGGIEFPTLFPHNAPHLVDPCFRVLETALFECRTATCKLSALHGLGHSQLQLEYAASEGLSPTRVTKIIDRYLALPGQPEHLRDYAEQARRGMVQ